MKVKELIELLSKEDPEFLVLVNGYECGYDEVVSLSKIKVIGPSVDKNWWDGEYWDCSEGEVCQDAILIPRQS